MAGFYQTSRFYTAWVDTVDKVFSGPTGATMIQNFALSSNNDSDSGQS
jgi:hypothetical protein